MMTQMRKLHNMNSFDKKIWGFFKSFLYLLSLSIMVFWGYIKDNDRGTIDNEIVDPVQQEISGQKQSNDSTYYAFARFLDEYSRNQN